MKKLVTAFALCAAISAMAVESENIVGYSTISIPQGLTVWSPTFVTVGGDETQTTLGDIVPSSSFFADNGLSMVQFLNPTGAGNVTLKAQYWDGFGWYELGSEENVLNDTVLPKGSSLLFTAAAASTCTFKGQVRQTGFTVSVPVGLSSIGNSIPKGITLADVVPSSALYADNGLSMLQILNPTGAGNVTLKVQYWNGYGWYELGSETNDLNSMALSQGTGFLVTAAAAGTITFPAAL